MSFLVFTIDKDITMTDNEFNGDAAPKTQGRMKMEIYRAANTAEIASGACFAEALEHARAYTENNGFGGAVVYSAALAGKVLRLSSNDAEAIAELFEAVGLDVREVADEWEVRDDDGYVIGVEREYRYQDALDATYVYEVWEGGLGVSLADLAAAGFSWVSYEDDYPTGCQTYAWTGLGETPVLTEVAG